MSKISKYVKLDKNILLEYVYDSENNISEAYDILVDSKEKKRSYLATETSGTNNIKGNQLFRLDNVSNRFGKIDTSYYTFLQVKNYATSNLATPNFMFYTDSVSGVTAGAYSFPLVYDYNQDGRTDLLLGNQTGKIIYYEDTSTTNVKKLALQTISLGGIKAGDVSNIYGYCAPTIAKMDETNKEYLVIGNVDGTLARYDDFINN